MVFHEIKLFECYPHQFDSGFAALPNEKVAIFEFSNSVTNFSSTDKWPMSTFCIVTNEVALKSEFTGEVKEN